MTTYLGEKAVGIGTVKATETVGKVITDEATILGDGFTDPLKVNTLLFATSESVAASAEAIRTEVNNKFTVVDSAIKGANEAIAKTRDDYIQADSEIHQMLNGLSAETTTIKNNQASLGTQVANIEHKIPDGTTGTNSLVNKQILAQTSYTKAEVDAKVSSVYKFKGSVSTYNSLPSTATTGDVYNVTDTGANYAWDGSKWDKLSETIDLTAYATTEYVTAREQDIRSDLGENISEVHTQVVGLSGEVAAVVSGKQDKLTAGDNITIIDNVISATGGGDYLPLSGGTLTGSVMFDIPMQTYSSVPIIGSAKNSAVYFYAGSANTDYPTYFGIKGGFAVQGYLEPTYVGKSANKVKLAYIKKINNGADIEIPTTGGTMALKEDIETAVGDISTALTAILGE